MPTPEGRLKLQVSEVLKNYQPHLWYYMPVPGGFGATTLDYIGCFHGFFFAVETKRPGKALTPRQEMVRSQMTQAGGIVFKVSGEFELLRLKAWLEQVRQVCDPDQLETQDSRGTCQPDAAGSVP